jgi:hypothetical protein
MSRDDILVLAKEYGALLEALGVEPEHIRDIHYRIDPGNPSDRQMLLRHGRWACEHIPEEIDKIGGHKRCMRWIGAIQGHLTAYGVLTVAEARARFSEFNES